MILKTMAGEIFLTFCLTIFLIHQPGCNSSSERVLGSNVSPEEALSNFYSNDGPEDTLMDPLILAGDKVVPLVLEKIKDKTMPRRRYAIGFLGNGSYKQALPILESILRDETEEPYIRGDALQSIYQMDEASGLRFAQMYKGEPGHLGKISIDLLTDRIYLPPRRTFSDALSSTHK
jgi:hypothetical protein